MWAGRAIDIGTAGCLVGLTAATWVVSGTSNYELGMAFNSSSHALANLTMDGLAAFLPFVAARNFRGGRWFTASVMGLFAAVFAVMAFSNMLEFLSMERASAHADREHDQSAYQMAEAKVARLKDQSRWMPDGASAAVVAARIAEAKQDVKFTRTDSCLALKITLAESRAFCDAYRKLETDLVAAGERQKLREEITKAEAELKATKKVVVVSGLAGLIHSWFSASESRVNEWWMFGKSLAIYLAHMFGLVFAEAAIVSRPVSKPSRPEPEAVQPVEATVQIEAAVEPVLELPAPMEVPADHEENGGKTETGHSQDNSSQSRVANLGEKRPPRTPEQGVKEWAKQVETGIHLFADLKGEYQIYCRRRGLPMVRDQLLGTALLELGHKRSKDKKQGGKVRYAFPAEIKGGKKAVALG